MIQKYSQNLIENLAFSKFKLLRKIDTKFHLDTTNRMWSHINSKILPFSFNLYSMIILNSQ